MYGSLVWVQSPPVTPLGMDGWRGWRGGWIREWMDATEREGGEIASVSCLPTDGSEGRRSAFLSSLSLTHERARTHAYKNTHISVQVCCHCIIELNWMEFSLNLVITGKKAALAHLMLFYDLLIIHNMCNNCQILYFYFQYISYVYKFYHGIRNRNIWVQTSYFKKYYFPQHALLLRWAIAR